MHDDQFENLVEQYIRDFPYQETFNYALAYTQDDPSLFNTWVVAAPALIKAGEDKVVRTNNDTFYKMGFLVLDHGPVVLRSSAPTRDRFSSFQLMDDRNVNYENVIHPEGAYTLYFGEKPDHVEGEAIEVPSNLSVVIFRVEVKDQDDPVDMAAAEKAFNGITIEGPRLETLPSVDLLSQYDQAVADEAVQRIDEAFASLPFSVVGPGQEPGVDLPYLDHAASTKGGWGGPGREHSSYETIQTDAAGEPLIGANGTYTLTTDEPPVDAFWSVTAYDTDRGGFFHPNKDDRYHINNTTAIKNADGTVTFTFKTACEEDDVNCLEVPDGPFDLASRYYLPNEEIINDDWQITRPRLQ